MLLVILGRHFDIGRWGIFLPERLDGVDAGFGNLFAILELEVKVALRLVDLVVLVEGPDLLVADLVPRVAATTWATDFHGKVAATLLPGVRGNLASPPVVGVLGLIYRRERKGQTKPTISR